MSTSIYLGMPPANVVKWIKENYVEPWPEKTSVVYEDGTTWEGLIEGELNDDNSPDMAFAEEITIGNKITSIGEDAFYGCWSLTSITIPNSVTSIGYQAFSGCESIKSILIPNSVIDIGAGAFSECMSLNKISILNETVNIGIDAFWGCPTNISFLNSTVSQVEQWFNSGVFGTGGNYIHECADNYVITCKDGIIKADGIWNEDTWRGEGWDITITPI